MYEIETKTKITTRKRKKNQPIEHIRRPIWPFNEFSKNALLIWDIIQKTFSQKKENLLTRKMLMHIDKKKSAEFNVWSWQNLLVVIPNKSTNPFCILGIWLRLSGKLSSMKCVFHPLKPINVQYPFWRSFGKISRRLAF